jgi:tellurite resistance protein TerB
MLDFFKKKLAQAQNKLEKLTVGPFANAAMAASAAIAMADGSLSDSEEDVVFNAIKKNENLAKFDMAELDKMFSAHIESLKGGRLGKRTVNDAISAINDDPDAAEIAAMLVLDIAESDGDFDEKEQTEARRIFGILNVDYDAMMAS